MKLIIALSNNEVTFALTERRTLLRYELLPAPVDDEALQGVLSGLPEGIETFLVLNLIEEERSLLNVAKVMPWEQEALFKRTLRRRIGSGALVYASHQAKVAGDSGRSELSTQIVSIKDTTDLDRFIELLSEHRLNIKAVYSQAELLAAACHQKKANKKEEAGAQIVVVRTGQDFYQQLLIIDDVVTLSRLIHVDASDPTALAQEQAGFERFIMVQRLVPYGQSFKYGLIAANQSDADSVLNALSNESGEHGEFSITIPDQKLKGSARLANDNPALATVLSTLNKTRPKTHFKPGYLEKNIKKRASITALWVFSVLILLAGGLQLASVATQAYSRWQLTMDMADMERRYLKAAREYEGQTNLPVRADDLQGSTAFVDKVLAQETDSVMRVAFVEVSKALRQFPALTLQEMRWKLASPSDTSKQKLRLSLTLKPAGRRLSELSGMVDDFVALLDKSPAVASVERDKLPIDTSASDRVQFDSQKLEKTVYEFDVRIKLGSGYASKD